MSDSRRFSKAVMAIMTRSRFSDDAPRCLSMESASARVPSYEEFLWKSRNARLRGDSPLDLSKI